MSFQKFKSDSSFVGGRHRSATKIIYGDINSKGSKLLIGYCSIVNRKKSMTVSDNTIEAERLSSFFKFCERFVLKLAKKIATNVLRIPARALEIGANVATADASRNPKAAY